MIKIKKFLFLLLFILTSNITFAFRPDSLPLISGDTFRCMADHIYDETTTYFDVEKVKPGDIIFINLSHQESFFLYIHPHIQSPYILISHNHDYSAPGPFLPYLGDAKLIMWFTQNADIVGHPKLIAIPIGLSNKHWNHSRQHDLFILQAQASLPNYPNKKDLLYVNFNVHTAPTVRQPVYDFFIRLPFCSWYANRPYPEYLLELAQAKFVLSPHGNGLDCHRTWEALYMGSFPLVKTSTLDSLYVDLPVLIVNSWEEVTPEFLESKFLEMKSGQYNYEKLYFRYWHDLIKSIQNKYK